MNRKSLDLLLVAAIAAIAIVATLAGWNTAPSMLVALALLVLLLPGYALTAAIFGERELARTERLFFGLGLSLTLTILGGFVLNWSPWRLEAIPWALLLGGITLVASLLAYLRRRLLPSQTTGWRPLELAPRQLLLLGLAAAVAGGAMVISRSGAVERERTTAFTQLWIFQAATPNTLQLGVLSHEPAATSYRLQLTLNGAMLREWTPLELEPGQRWEVTESLAAIQPGDVIEALLYRSDAPHTVYRRGIFRPDRRS